MEPVVSIGETVKFTDSSGLNYEGQVICIRDGIASIAVLGYDDLFRLKLNVGEKAFDRMKGSAGGVN